MFTKTTDFQQGDSKKKKVVKVAGKAFKGAVGVGTCVGMTLLGVATAKMIVDINNS